MVEPAKACSAQAERGLRRKSSERDDKGMRGLCGGNTQRYLVEEGREDQPARVKVEAASAEPMMRKVDGIDTLELIQREGKGWCGLKNPPAYAVIESYLRRTPVVRALDGAAAVT
jgi:hypothetical protein